MRYIVPGEMSLHGYTDNHAIKLSISSDDTFLARNNPILESDDPKTRDIPGRLRALENCAEEIKLWMNSNHLKMNSSKTEFILFGHQKQLKMFQRSDLR